MSDLPPPDEQRVDQAIRALTGSGVAGIPVARAIDQVLDATVEAFGLSGAGLMIVDGDQVLRSVAATDPPGELLERTQEEIGHGPCVESVVLDAVVTSSDALADDRWPELGLRLASQPIGAVLGVPVRLAGGAVAALDVYDRDQRDWTQADVDALTAFARVLETVLGTAVLAGQRETTVEQLQQALDHRVSIERAVGLLMGRHGLDAVAAFDRLRADARSQRRRAVDVALELLDDQRPEPHSP